MCADNMWHNSALKYKQAYPTLTVNPMEGEYSSNLRYTLQGVLVSTVQKNTRDSRKIAPGIWGVKGRKVITRGPQISCTVNQQCRPMSVVFALLCLVIEPHPQIKTYLKPGLGGNNYTNRWISLKCGSNNSFAIQSKYIFSRKQTQKIQ